MRILERKVEHIKIAKHNERTNTQKDSNTTREPINDKKEWTQIKYIDFVTLMNVKVVDDLLKVRHK